jgi:hypothetical protein
MTLSRIRPALAAGLVAVAVGVGAVSGPTASASPGTTAPARHTGNVTNALGTHHSGLTTGNVSASASSAACPHSSYGGGFYTSLAGGWSSLSERSAPCRAAGPTGTHYRGQRWYVYNESEGEFICRGRAYDYGSSIWYNSGRPRVDPWQWSWSGGTADPQWNHHSC